MAKERLSKLQKWIITNCFKVNVLLDRTGLEDLRNYDCWSYDKIKCPERIVKERNFYNSIENKCGDKQCCAFDFYREDILLSYFNLKRTNKGDSILWHKAEHFLGSVENNKAYVTLSRSLKNLMDKNLIYTWKPWKEDSLRILLTDEGKRIAMRLLNLDPSVLVEPEEKSDEVCQKEFEEHEARKAWLRAKYL